MVCTSDSLSSAKPRHKSGGLTVPTSSGSHVKKGEDPRHKELREGEQIRPDYFSDYLSLHHIGKPAHQDEEG